MMTSEIWFWLKKCAKKTLMKIQVQLLTSTLEGGDMIEAYLEANQIQDTEVKASLDLKSRLNVGIVANLIITWGVAQNQKKSNWWLDSWFWCFISLYTTPWNDVKLCCWRSRCSLSGWWITNGYCGLWDVQIKTMNESIWNLINVRYVLELKKKLIFVGQLEDSGHSIFFSRCMWKVLKVAMVLAREK